MLVPAYNGGELLRAAVASVLAQTYDDFELLVVDDCSNDGSADFLAAHDDPRIRLVRNERNLGQVPTLNRGLELARGEYVARLDQDDACLPARLERQVAVLDCAPRVGVVGSFMDLCDGEDRPAGRLGRRVDDAADFAFLLLTNQLPLTHPTVTFRLAPVREIGGYDVALRYAEDQDLWRRLALAGWEARVVPEALVRYRVHEGQQSHRHSDEQQANNLAALERFVGELADDVEPEPLRRLLAWDDAFWADCLTRENGERTASQLERLVRGAPARLGLGSADAAKLERLLRARVALAARRSWRSGVRTHWRAAPPLLRFGLAGASATAKLEAAAVYALAPALPPLRAVEARLPSPRR